MHLLVQHPRRNQSQAHNLEYVIYLVPIPDNSTINLCFVFDINLQATRFPWKLIWNILFLDRYLSILSLSFLWSILVGADWQSCTP